MSDGDERRRILDMLAAGTISVDDAANLLKALSGPPGQPPEPPAPRRRGGQARLLRISIDDADSEGARGESTKVRVNVPIALARFATRFLPKDASDELRDQGIDLAELISSLDEDLPDGKLLEVEAEPDDPSKAKTRIVIEVV